MIILVANEKGGTGKSLVAANLAALAAAGGLRPVLVDADPQGTSLMWSAIRKETGAPPVPALAMNAGEMQAGLARLAEKAGLVVLDAGGRDSREMRAGLLLADLVVVPFRPSQFDLWGVERMSQLIGQALGLNRSLGGLAVMNQVSTNPMVREAGEAREFFTPTPGFRLARAILRDRVAYGRAAGEGLGVTELKPPDQKASAEMAALYAEVMGG